MPSGKPGSSQRANEGRSAPAPKPGAGGALRPHPRGDQATNLLAAIVDSSEDAIISKNLDGIITSWNKSAERMFGYTADEAVGQSIMLIIPPERRDEEARIIGHIRRGEKMEHFETVRRRKDGSTFEIALTVSPVRDGSGKVVGASKVARDITELKKTQENYRRLAETLEIEVRERTRELEASNADLLRQSQQLSELSGRLLHIQDEERRHIARDLHDSTGQLLALLNMNLSSLRKVCEGREGIPQNMFEDCVSLAAEITSQIRTVSYLLHPPLLDEMGLTSALRWLAEGFEQRSGIAVTIDIPSDFGRLEHDLEIVLFRIVQESLSNVHRHSGGKNAWIEVSHQGDSVWLEIRDDGQGIPPQRMAEIKERSFGVGIGGMRERVRKAGGTFDIRSDEKGTRVSVLVPAQFRLPEAPAPVKSAATNGDKAHEASNGNATKRVLVIDDHELMRRGVRVLLEQEENIEICGEASNAQEGIELIQQIEPDLVVLDLNMPEANGWSLVREIRRLGLSPKIVIFTAHNYPQMTSAVIAAGCDGLVVKSRAGTELVKAIRTALAGGQFLSGAEAAAPASETPTR